jgi:hypothetical protein
MLFKRKPREGEEAAASDAPKEERVAGSAILRDELGLFQPWYLDMRYREELARAARGAVIFSIAAWSPRLLGDDDPDPAIMARVAKLIADKLRDYDIACRIDERRILALLLDADYHHASTVAYRIKADIQIQIPGAGKWRAGAATYGRDGVDADSLMQVALRRLEEDSAQAA